MYTPGPIARRLARAALDGAPPPCTVCDPAAGDGRLLAAVAHAGSAPALFGADLDDLAWAHGPGRDLPGVRFCHGDSLLRGRATWPDAPEAGFDLVIGNPPFRNQLERATALGADERRRLKERYGALAGGYADTASVFLVAACEMAAADGRVAMIMPLSFLSARDAAPARRKVLEDASLIGVWLAGAHVFPDADVQVCALVLQRGPVRRRNVARWFGPEWTPAPPLAVDSDQLRDAPTWSRLLTGLIDETPPVGLVSQGRLGDLVAATAGFRRQFYGLAPHLVEGEGDVGGRTDGRSPMITCGLVDPGRVRWGERPCRIAGRRWERPLLDARDIDDGGLSRWVTGRLRPKLVVATQTRVIEAVADPTGEWIPSTPVIAVHGDDEDLWKALAVLLAPPVTLWARQQFAGAALSIDAIKLSARQVLDLPLPGDRTGWDRAARVLKASHSVRRGGATPEAVVEAARVMTAAYGCDEYVHQWWLGRAWSARPADHSG